VLVAFDRATLPWHAGQMLRAGERHGGLILIPPHHSDHQRRRAGTIADRILVGRWPHMRLGQPNRLPADVAVNEGGFGSHNIELMQSALEAIHEYYKAFSTLDVKAIVSYFCEPVLDHCPAPSVIGRKPCVARGLACAYAWRFEGKGVRAERVCAAASHPARRDGRARTGSGGTVHDRRNRNGTDPNQLSDASRRGRLEDCSTGRWKLTVD
jgi:hypothetical protein